MIPLSEPLLGENELEYVIDCIKTNWVSYLGKYVDLFEERFAKFCKAGYAVAISIPSLSWPEDIPSLSSPIRLRAWVPATRAAAWVRSVTWSVSALMATSLLLPAAAG